jgi:uncharacterized protein YerC
MRTVSPAELSGRFVSFAEREEIAILNAQGCGVREIARRTGRSPSTISRVNGHEEVPAGGHVTSPPQMAV